MAATIQNTGAYKYYKTKSDPGVFRTADNSWVDEATLFKEGGYQNWDQANQGIETVGSVWKNPNDAAVNEYNPYTKTSKWLSEEAFNKAGYDWGNIAQGDPNAPAQPAPQPTYQPIGETGQAYQPLLETYKTRINSMLDPVTAAYKAYQSQQENQTDPEAYEKQLREQYNMTDTETLLNELRKQMLGTEGLIEALPGDIANTTQDFQVSQSARNLQQSAKQQSLVDQLSKQSRATEVAGIDRDYGMNAINNALAMRQQKEANALKPLSTALEAAKYGFESMSPIEQQYFQTMLAGTGADVAKKQSLEDQAATEAIRQRIRDEDLTDYEKQLQIAKKYQSSGGSYSAPKVNKVNTVNDEWDNLMSQALQVSQDPNDVKSILWNRLMQANYNPQGINKQDLWDLWQSMFSNTTGASSSAALSNTSGITFGNKLSGIEGN